MSKNMFGPPTAHPIPLGRLSKCQGRRVGRRGGVTFSKIYDTRHIFRSRKMSNFRFRQNEKWSYPESNDHTSEWVEWACWTSLFSASTSFSFTNFSFSSKFSKMEEHSENALSLGFSSLWRPKIAWYALFMETKNVLCSRVRLMFLLKEYVSHV